MKQESWNLKPFGEFKISTELFKAEKMQEKNKKAQDQKLVSSMQITKEEGVRD